MPDNYHNAFQEACDLVDAGRSDADALALAGEHYGLTPAQREQLAREFKLLGSHAPYGRRRAEYEDAQGGMRWWNGLSEGERAQWLGRVESASVAAAWRVFKTERGS